MNVKQPRECFRPPDNGAALESYVDAHLTEAGIAVDDAAPLFRTAAGETGKLIDRRMTRTDALHTILMTRFYRHRSAR
jgi:hypothetical protein